MKECCHILWNAIGSSICTVGLTAAVMYPAVYEVPEESSVMECDTMQFYVQWAVCWRSLLKKNSSYALKMEVADIPETLINLHQSTGCHILEDFIDAAIGMPELACKF